MKFIGIVAAFAASALAQRIAIGAPPPGSDISPGQSLTVEVDRPDSLTGSQEVSVAIGLLSCASFPDGSCDFIDVSQDLGTVLFAGPYAPQLTDSAKPPNENFTVQIPDSLPLGTASLNVAHFSLIGAGPLPFLEVQNITLNVVSSSAARRFARVIRD